MNDRNLEEIYALIKLRDITIDEVIKELLSSNDAEATYCFMKHEFDYLLIGKFLGQLDDTEIKDRKRLNLLMKRVVKLTGGKKELIKKLANHGCFTEIREWIYRFDIYYECNISINEAFEAILSLDDVKTIYDFMKHDEKAAKIHDLLIKKIIELKDYEYILKILADAITFDLKNSKTANARMGDYYFFTALSRRDTEEGYGMLRQYSYAIQEKLNLNNYEESILNNLQLLLDALSDCDDLSLIKEYKEKVAMGSIKKYLEKLISKLSGVQHEEDNTPSAETSPHCKNVSEPSKKSYQPNKDTSKLPNKSDNESKSHYKIIESKSHLSKQQKYAQERYREKTYGPGLTSFGYGLPLQGYSRNRRSSINQSFGPMNTPYDIKRRKRKK